MPQLQLVTDDAEAVALADRLNGDQRVRPVVVVTIPSGRVAPYIDAEQILYDVGDLADVYLIATGAHTWSFSDKMPEFTQVYGGAGRVYPVGHEWASRPQASPLRFAYDEAEGERSTRALVSDTLRMAAQSGLLQKTAARHRTWVEGQVMKIVLPERALVTYDGGLAPVAQELTVPGVPLPRVLSEGMTVSGWLDSETRRLDISETLLDPAVALAGYSIGDVVLAEVGEVGADTAELLLHPHLAVRVSRDAVTSNELDDLRTLMTPGEVLCARVVSVGPAWSLTLLDVEDDDLPVPAAALLDGGPPWLTPPSAEEVPGGWSDRPPDTLPEFARPTVEPVPGAGEWRDVDSERIDADADALPFDGGSSAERPQVPAATTAVPPTPAILDRKRPSPEPAEPSRAASGAVSSMRLTIDGLRAELGAAARHLRALRDEVRAGTAERRALIESREGQDRQIARLMHELQVQRARLRKANQAPRSAPRPEPEFRDRALGFRYAVLTAWATRIPAASQGERPLPQFLIGPDFLESVDRLEGISLDKIADVVFEVVTGLAKDISGREVHHLRESAAADAPHVRRQSDDAMCWRAALQKGTPQARRLHYWVLPGGQVELSRVTRHDDFTP